MVQQSAGVLRCSAVACRLALKGTDTGYVCEGCGTLYVRRSGIIDLLGTPRGAVAQELRGLASENAIDIEEDDFDAVKFMRVPLIEDIRTLMGGSRSGRVQYYQQTTAAFYEGFSRAKPDAGRRVLEIGAERSFFKLRAIGDMFEEAYALNIFFHVTIDNEDIDFPERVLGDMNDLPFIDNTIDLVVCSATLHHSSTPEIALEEIARVLRPGGRALMLNEPVEGVAKAFSGKHGHDRDEQIHEDPVTFKRWMNAIADSGLKADHFLPAWFLAEVADAARLSSDVRFVKLARILAPLMAGSLSRDILGSLGRVPGQWFLGLPINAVLWKTDA